MSCNADVSIALTSSDFLRFKAAYENEAALHPEEFAGGLIYGFEKVPLNSKPQTGYKEKDGFVVISWRSTRWDEGHDPQVDFVRKFLSEELTEYQYLCINEYGKEKFIDRSDGWDLVRPVTVVESRFDYAFLMKVLY